MKIWSLFICTLFLFAGTSFAQTEDSLVVKNDSIVSISGVDTSLVPVADSIKKRKHSPRKAAIRSAILPGWGQAYNRKYWKIPLVYGALGTTAFVFRFNIRQYRDIQFAYKTLVNNDSANFPNVAPELQPFIEFGAVNDLFNARSEVRQNIDYSVLIFLGFWGLNVVDALVDAHLKEFDVSPDLTLKFKPGYNQFSNTSGITLVLDIHKGKPRPLTLPHFIR
jgi:hypothetical protein